MSRASESKKQRPYYSIQIVASAKSHTTLDFSHSPISTEFSEKSSANRRLRIVGRLRLQGILAKLHVQSFVGFLYNMIHDGFEVLSPIPNGKLPVCTGAFAHNLLDVCNLFLAAQFVHFGGD